MNTDETRIFKKLLLEIVPCYFKAQMDNQPATNPTRSSPACLWPWLFVLAVLLFVGFIRVRLLDMPLERDEGEYAYAGQLILQGIPPYELAYNMKLPGTYFIYALGMAVFGETSAGVHLTLLVANALTIVFVFLLARKLFGTTAGLVACASYGVMAVNSSANGGWLRREAV
jgi:4-amino-4-deoxy-L-arabinose transferase-like glycosyltransferase